ncbi:molybdenum cofactor guanylyltransferase [Catellatospora vulcania]|uniref:molybdenum cofactor guanylyltransferase n=1 Tax=Catellatospora vulcania TaxID=1460450 RepID=UPI0012D39B6C|nr:NTP transferase domain-containing protein [Catellatospora vulcania]
MVLAGGAARRMGGLAKPLLPVGGVPMLRRVLSAVADARPLVVVGGPELAAELPTGALLTREDPPGGGPVAAIAAGAAALPETGDSGRVLVVAADLPFLTREAVAALLAVDADVVMFTDPDGRRQHLCAAWRLGALRAALPASAHGAPMRALLADADVVELPWAGAGPAPWYDCDTPDELKAAQAADAAAGS